MGRKKPDALIPVPVGLKEMPEGYGTFLSNLKARITHERLKTVLSANAAMVLLYWDLGQSILERQHQEGWGAKVIDRLSHDLKTAFPEMTGFSSRNLKYMRKFAEAWPEREFVQQLAAQIPWFHNCLILDKLQDRPIREWYISKTIENGWSRNILAMQIKTRLHERGGKAANNFGAALPPTDSDMAAQIFKDPYVLEHRGRFVAPSRRQAIHRVVAGEGKRSNGG